MAKITILGSGGWGMALAVSAHSSGHEVTLWSPFKEEVEGLKKNRGNERLLSGVKLPDGIGITTDLSVVTGSSVTVIATPSTTIRGVAAQLSAHRDIGIVVNVAKGLEKGSLLSPPMFSPFSKWREYFFPSRHTVTSIYSEEYWVAQAPRPLSPREYS